MSWQYGEGTIVRRPRTCIGSSMPCASSAPASHEAGRQSSLTQKHTAATCGARRAGVSDEVEAARARTTKPPVSRRPRR